MEETVAPLTDVERAWVREQLAAAVQFMADYGSQRNLTGLALLDHAWASWLDRQSVDPEDPNTVINAVGVFLGQSLAEALEGFDWVIAEDANGTDLAIFGLPDVGDVLIYPANLVAKRYEGRETPFLVATHEAIVEQVRQLRG